MHQYRRSRTTDLISRDHGLSSSRFYSRIGSGSVSTSDVTEDGKTAEAEGQSD
jgi:hypothetical protein